MGARHFVLPVCRGAQFKIGSFALCNMAEMMIKTDFFTDELPFVKHNM